MKTVLFIYSLSLFYSRVILKKLNESQLSDYRQVERSLKKVSKLKADIKYLRFCSANQLLPKFTNFKLYDVSAENEPSTLNFRKTLLKREIEVKSTQLRDEGAESVRNILKYHRSVSIQFLCFLTTTSKGYHPT